MSLTNSEIDVTVGATIGGTTYQVLPSNSGSQNTTSLQKLLEWLMDEHGATNGSGGTLIFPSVGDQSGTTANSYQFAGHVTVGFDIDGMTVKPYSIVIRGDGQQQAMAPLLVQTTSDDLFVINTNNSMDNDDVGGVLLQDLMISYAPTTPTAGNSAIKVTEKSQATRLLRVSLLNWPVGVNFNECGQCSMIDCRVLTTASTIATTAVQIGDAATLKAAIETYIAGCYFFDDTETGTGMQIYGCEHLRVMNTRIEQYQSGVVIAPTNQTDNAQYIYFANVSCHPVSSTATAGAALSITTSGDATSKTFVFHAQFVGCEFSASDNEATSWLGGGVVIGPASGAEDAIDQIRFLDCHVCNWPGPGLYVDGGSGTTTTPTNIELVGGYYSCNGSSPATGLQSAGILIVGGSSGPSGIRITGAACNNSLFSPATKLFNAATQLYGVYVTGAAKNVRVIASDLTGNEDNGVYIDGTSGAPVNLFIRDCDVTGSPVHVTAPVNNLQIVDCPGYNDQKTLIATAFPLLNHAFTIAALGSTPYYGPGECYVNVAGAAVKVNGQSTFIVSGSFYLQPLETIEIDTSVTNFVAIGK